MAICQREKSMEGEGVVRVCKLFSNEEEAVACVIFHGAIVGFLFKLSLRGSAAESCGYFSVSAQSLSYYLDLVMGSDAPCGLAVMGVVKCRLPSVLVCLRLFFFFQAEDGIRDDLVTGVQTCALPISIA